MYIYGYFYVIGNLNEHIHYSINQIKCQSGMFDILVRHSSGLAFAPY